MRQGRQRDTGGTHQAGQPNHMGESRQEAEDDTALQNKTGCEENKG